MFIEVFEYRISIHENQYIYWYHFECINVFKYVFKIQMYIDTVQLYVCVCVCVCVCVIHHGLDDHALDAWLPALPLPEGSQSSWRRIYG